jgi:lipoprotein NlpI
VHKGDDARTQDRPVRPEEKKAAAMHYDRGRALAKKGRSELAIVELSRAVRLNPEESAAYSERGRLYAERGELVKAGEDYDRAIARRPDSPALFYNRGIILYKKGQYRRAIEDFSRAIELEPGDPESYNNRGGALLAAGDADGAVVDYARALGLRNDYARAYANRGVALFYRGDFPGALADFDRALRGEPADAMALHNRGIVRYVLGDRAGALADFNAVIAIDPKNQYSRIWRLALAAGRGDAGFAALLKEERARYASPAGSWPGTLVRGFLGLVSEAELLRKAAAADDARLAGERRAEALYYLGLRKKTIGGGDAPAVDYFKNCLAGDASMTHARRLARFELSGD